MRNYYRDFILLVIAAFVVLAIAAAVGCGEGPCKNLRDCPIAPVAHTHDEGCGHGTPDAGVADARVCPPCPDAGPNEACINPCTAESPLP